MNSIELLGIQAAHVARHEDGLLVIVLSGLVFDEHDIEPVRVCVLNFVLEIPMLRIEIKMSPFCMWPCAVGRNFSFIDWKLNSVSLFYRMSSRCRMKQD